MTDRTAFSAPGKLMLFGEFAVLEGHPAVALCFDGRIRCEARRGGGLLRFDAPELLFDGAIEVPLSALSGPPDRSELQLLWPFFQQVVPRLGGLSLRFDAEFPSTWGLGSSSASSLAAVAATRALLGEKPDETALFAEVRSLQQEFQGRASGYDAATQLLGGVVLFSDPAFAGAPGPLQLERVDAPPMPWLVGYTGRKASTSKMLLTVGSEFPSRSPIYDRIGQLAHEGLASLRAGDVAAVGDAMNRGHGLLVELGAVPADLAWKVTSLQATAGVQGARMCGAGGGDCVLMLADDRQAAIDALQAVDFSVLPLTFTETGLRAEPTDQEAPHES